MEVRTHMVRDTHSLDRFGKMSPLTVRMYAKRMSVRARKTLRIHDGLSVRSMNRKETTLYEKAIADAILYFQRWPSHGMYERE